MDGGKSRGIVGELFLIGVRFLADVFELYVRSKGISLAGCIRDVSSGSILFIVKSGKFSNSTETGDTLLGVIIVLYHCSMTK